MYINNVKRKDLRIFGFVLGVLLAILAARLFYKFHNVAYLYAGTASGVCVLLSAAYPFALKPVYTGWMRVARIIGWINTRLILTAIFYFIVAPIGIITRLMGKDYLDMKIEKKKASYWAARERKVFDPARCEKQF